MPDAIVIVLILSKNVEYLKGFENVALEETKKRFKLQNLINVCTF